MQKNSNMKKFVIFIFIIFGYSFELKYDSFSANFTQIVKSDNKTIVYNGDLFVKNNKVFWHYSTPIEKKIWITNKIYVYEPDLEQVTIYNKKDNLFQLIKTAKKIKSHLYKKYYNNKNIYFVTKNKMIIKIYYKDKINNVVSILFKNIQPKKLLNKIFTPSYPNYVDIIYSQ